MILKTEAAYTFPETIDCPAMLETAKERRLVETYSRMLSRGLCATKAKRRLQIYSKQYTGKLSPQCVAEIAALTESARVQKHLAQRAR